MFSQYSSPPALNVASVVLVLGSCPESLLVHGQVNLFGPCALKAYWSMAR